MKRKFFLIISCFVLITSFTACSKKEIVYEDTQVKMDTVVHLKAYGPNAEAAVKESMKRVDEIEQLASSTIETSDVSKINKAAGKEYIKVHPEILKMIKTSLTYSNLSNGAWDIDLGPIINLWGIGTSTERLPSDSEIKALVPLVNYKDILVDDSNSSVMLKRTGMSIDLGGIAKGFAEDELRKIYSKYNITEGLIDLGGSSIYAVGKKPDNSLWTVAIQHPRKDKNETYLGVMKLSNQAIATSGDYERYFIKDGKRYHHIINPATGYPTDNGVVSVTILIGGSDPDASMKADMLSTTVFVLGPEKGIKLIDSLPNTSCMVITSDYTIYKSANFKQSIESLNSDFKYAK